MIPLRSFTNRELLCAIEVAIPEEMTELVTARPAIEAVVLL